MRYWNLINWFYSCFAMYASINFTLKQHNRAIIIEFVHARTMWSERWLSCLFIREAHHISPQSQTSPWHPLTADKTNVRSARAYVNSQKQCRCDIGIDTTGFTSRFGFRSNLVNKHKFMYFMSVVVLSEWFTCI